MIVLSERRRWEPGAIISPAGFCGGAGVATPRSTLPSLHRFFYGLLPVVAIFSLSLWKGSDDDEIGTRGVDLEDYLRWH